VSDLKFAQPAQRNLLVPVLLAFLILGIILALVVRLNPHRTPELTITRTVVVPTHIVFKSETIVVSNQHAEDHLYVLATLRIDDRLRLPLYLKDFTATLTTATGEELTTSAIEKQDLENVYTSFPELKPFATEPLLRETWIDPGKSAEGMILLRFPVAKDVWDHRRSAVINIDFYHQGTQQVEIPQSSETATPQTSHAN
jgi:hypothetical protein